MAGLGVNQISPLDNFGGFSQTVSVSLGSGGSYGNESSWASTTGSGTAEDAPADDKPNWTVIAAFVAVAGYLFLRK